MRTRNQRHHRSATPDSVSVGEVDATDAGEGRLLASLGTMRTHATGNQPRRIEDTIRDLRKRHLRGIAHLVTIARDAFRRHAPVEDLKAPAREWDAMVEDWCDERDGTAVPLIAPTHRAEEHSEALKEEAETAFSYSRGPREAAELLAAIDRHAADDAKLARICRAAISGAQIC